MARERHKLQCRAVSKHFRSVIIFNKSSDVLSDSVPLDGLENAQSYTWTVSLSYAGGPTFEVNNDSAVPSNIFHFAIYNYTATSYAIRSHSFNITAAPNNTSPSTTTTGASSPTHSAGSDVQDPNATISPSASATSSPAPGGGGGGSGLSTGAQAGIGVGVGIAGLAAIAALVWFFRFRNRTPSATPAERQPMYVEQKPPFAEGPPNQGTEVNKYDGNYIGELPTDRGAEMPAGNFHQPSHELPGN